MDDLQALKEKLDSVKGLALQKAERKALRKAGQIIQTAIKQRAPIQSGEYAGGSLKPGELSASIKARIHIADDQNVGDTSRVTVGPNRETAHVALWVEYGHANPKAVNGAKNTPAHPFIRPAADLTEQPAIDAYTESMTADLLAALE